MQDITVSGTVFDAENNAKANAVLTVIPRGVTGALLHSASFTVTSNESGVVSFTCARNAQYTIKGNVLGLTGDGLLTTMPDASSVTLESLVASSLVTATFGNPMTGLGDMIYGGNASGLATRLAPGDEGEYLSIVDGVPSWVEGTGGGATSLNGLSDVTLTAAATGNFLRKSAGDWVNTNLVAGDIPDISATYSLSGHTHSGVYEPANSNIQSHISNTSNPHSVTKSQVGLGSVENTALSTWAGSSNITTLGTIGTGVWNGTAIAYSKLSLTGAILNADLAGSIAISKLSITGTPDGTKFLRDDGSWQTVSGGSGDVVGPSSSTDNAIARFDSTTGKLLQNSSATVNDNGRVITAGGANGGVYFGSTSGISDSNSDGRLDFFAGGSSRMDIVDVGGGYRTRILGTQGISTGSGGIYIEGVAQWNGDSGIGRNAAGVLEINDHNAGAFRDLLARGLRSNAVAFASAIGSPVEGTMQAFTDSSTATWGATITGGGANHVLGYFNGTNWTVAAK